MAREILTRCTCDRCKKTIEEVTYTGEDEAPPKPKVYIESKGVGHDEPIRFDDLCGSCQDRVTALFAQIVLDKSDKEDKNGKNGKGDKEPPAEQKDKPDKGAKGKGGDK